MSTITTPCMMYYERSSLRDTGLTCMCCFVSASLGKLGSSFHHLSMSSKLIVVVSVPTFLSIGNLVFLITTSIRIFLVCCRHQRMGHAQTRNLHRRVFHILSLPIGIEDVVHTDFSLLMDSVELKSASLQYYLIRDLVSCQDPILAS